MTFGSFDALCAQSPLPLCSLLGPLSTLTSPAAPLLRPICSARAIELANTIIFEGATDFAHIAALGMTAVMILHVRSKFTAVGRKEILTFFYIYLTLTVVSLILDAGVLEARSGGAFPWFVAVQNGLASALFISLLVNGFVGFQLYEDGTNLSVWLLRLSSLGVFVISFAVSLLTFKGWAGLGPTNTTGLFIVLYIINAIALFVYLAMQVLLVVNTLQDRWPLAHLTFGVFFFVVGQVILYTLGSRICEGLNHYLDGMFFATLCNLLAVMMVYKYWDSITKEDLEFSVGTKQGSWAAGGVTSDVKDPLLMGGLDAMDDSRRASAFDLSGGTARNSLYDLHAPATPSTMRPMEREPINNSQQHQRNPSQGPTTNTTSSQPHSRSQSRGPSVPARYHRNRSHSRSQSRGHSRDRMSSNAGGTIPGALLLEGVERQQQTRSNVSEGFQIQGHGRDWRSSRHGGELVEIGTNGVERDRERDRERRERRRESRNRRINRSDEY